MSWKGSLSAENLIWGRSATSFSIVRFSFFFYVSKSSIVPGLISWAKKLKMSVEHFWAPRNSQVITSASSVQHRLLWWAEGEWTDGKGSVTYLCRFHLLWKQGAKRTTFYVVKLSQGHSVIKWHQKLPTLRWSSKMNYRLQWSKVRN